MRIWPTWKELCHTLALSWMVAFGIMAWSYHSLWKLYERKWDDVAEAAKLYDFDRDGRAMVEIIYREE